MNNMGNGEKREGEKAEEGRSSCHYPFTKPGSNYTEHNIGKAVFHVNSRYTMLSPVSTHSGIRKNVTVPNSSSSSSPSYSFFPVLDRPRCIWSCRFSNRYSNGAASSH